MRMSDAPSLRRLCIQMSVAGYGDVGYFINLPVEELMEVAREISRISKERKRNAKSKTGKQ